MAMHAVARNPRDNPNIIDHFPIETGIDCQSSVYQLRLLHGINQDQSALEPVRSRAETQRAHRMSMSEAGQDTYVEGLKLMVIHHTYA